MKKNILFLTLLCGLSFFYASCSDEEGNIPRSSDETEDPSGAGNSAITKLAWQETDKIVAFLNESKDLSVNLQLSRLGSSNTATVTATLSILTQSELDAYNTANNRTYSLLPAEYYTLPTSVELATDVKKQKVDMTIKSNIKNLTDLNSKQYVIPVRLSSENCEIREGYDITMIQLKATTPQFAMVESGTVGEITDIISGLTGEIEKKLNVSLNVDNRWDSKVVFVTDPTTLQALVDTYNQTSNEGEAILLPASNYSLPADNKLVFTTEDESSKEFTIKVNSPGKPALEEGDYILPIALASCEDMPFLVDREKVAYLRFSVLTPTFSVSLKSGESASTVTQAGTSTNKKLNILLNTEYQWETASTIAFADNADNYLKNLVDEYNTLNKTAYTLLPADNYTYPSISFGKSDKKQKEISITIKPKGNLTNGQYLLPVALKSSNNTAIKINTESVCYLQISVMGKQNLTSDMLSTNNYENSPWTILPVSNLIDDTYWGGKDANFWSGAWNWKDPQGNAIDKSGHYDTTYGIYVDINISNLGLTTAANFVIHSTSKDGSRNPKSLNLYTSNAESGDSWVNAGSVTDAPSAYKNITGNSNATNASNPTTISVQEITTPIMQITSSTKRIRIAFIKNQNNSDLRTDQNATVRADELYMYGY